MESGTPNPRQASVLTLAIAVRVRERTVWHISVRSAILSMSHYEINKRDGM